MRQQFSELARQALLFAEDAAQSMNHDYVGTEHLLLGLLQSDSGDLASALTALGVDANEIRPRIEQLVQRGPQPVSQRKLPFTPWANRAIELADEDARFLQQERIGPEHLLFGLLREREGVAGQVLLSLGLQPEAVALRVFNFRLMQLKYVERIVRPVLCTTPRKRKMREELLAHLTAIYDEELARLSDPDAAWATAAERFGIPAELTCELERSLSWSERVSYFVERRTGWRPPETANRWMARAAMQSAALFALMNVGAAAAMISKFGCSENVLIGMRPLLVVLMLLPVLLFVLGAAYFQMRDSIYGAFGSRRSNFVAGGMALLMGLSVFAALLAFVALTYPGFDGRSGLVQLCLTAFAVPLCALAIARHVGRQEIRDAMWACMDLKVPESGTPPTEPA